MIKYKTYVQEMIAQHQVKFDAFTRVHEQYRSDPIQYQDEFNIKGAEIMSIIHDWENMLCSKSQGGQYSKFATNLADKFMDEVRKIYPKIDFIGVTS